MQNNTFDKKVLLYSGGMDSWLIDKIWKPDVKLYVDMNTEYSQEEIERLPEDVIVIKLDLSAWEREDKIIPLRNMFLIGLATNYGNEICLGATAGDRVLDKSPMFADLHEPLLTYLYQEQHWTEKREIRINLDFKKHTKTELVRMFVEQGGDIQEAFNSSFSCYHPHNGEECWSCKPCYRKFIAFALNGYQFPPEIVTKAISYIKSDILPLIHAGKYGRKQEEKEILQVLNLFK
ncbi:MAG: 7-cyano-7-deazaguanine synthase [Tannerellaceae bacterium]|nr:7-cyano-7-deazaguanine synthase [Tannerellaceae bacterium]